ncbi:helix-turn-helix domain-containing protein [Reichenbachiella carrageenanivorans]|uniref:histidine kinase n=1 Tax=Reichenbachiella carrageenanivorans TaxID=2979869 RepID=A0ABY6CUU6_9BACT|nr:two-component regulator propeller domain-containing protein [Reichenbachiella carrageenanivorans]UXX77695.1 helix-turn-helix domain-containing protein [Reichenbachiella carrageenanivorans]
MIKKSKENIVTDLTQLWKHRPYLSSHTLGKSLSLLFTLCIYNLSAAVAQSLPIIDAHIESLDNPVYAITQDKDGFLWFGSQYGLIKYDGSYSETFISDEQDSTTLIDNWVWSLYNDSQNNLWVGTSRGLNLWSKQNNSFIHIPLIGSNEDERYTLIREIYEDDNDHLWICTNNGLYMGSITDREFNRFEWTYNYNDNQALDVKDIMSYYGDLMVLSQFGISVISSEGETYSNKPYPNQILTDAKKSNPRSLVLDEKDSVVWIGNQNEYKGLTRYDLKSDKKSKFRIADRLNANSIRVIKQYQQDELLIGTRNGLYLFHTKTEKLAPLLLNRSIKDIFLSADGSFWVATYHGGIYHFVSQGSTFELVNKSTSAKKSYYDPSHVICSIVETEDDNLWFGTNQGLFYLPTSSDSLKNEKTISVRKADDIRTRCMVYDGKGNIWIGTSDGIIKYDRINDILKTYPLDDNLDNSLKEINNIIYANNQIWVATNGSGLYGFEPDKEEFTQYYNHFNRSSNFIFALNATENGTIWIGSNAGLSAFDSKTAQTLSIHGKNLNFEHRNIRVIKRDLNNRLWIGTENSGLIFYDPRTNEHRTLTKEEGLYSNRVKSMEIDEKQNLWVTTFEGISKIETNHPTNIHALKFNIVDFTVNNLGTEVLFLPRSSVTSTQGEMYFGTRNGLIKFNPSKINSSHVFPKVWLKDLSINQQSIMKNDDLLAKYGNVQNLKSIAFNHDETIIKLFLSTINYSQQYHIYYSYFLEGLSPEWQMLDENTLNLNYLPPGKYTLKLKASSSNQVWFEDYTSIDIVVHPPFYKSAFAFVIYTVVILLLMYLFYHFSATWQALKNKLKVEELEKKKAAELSQLKSQFFINISHEFKLPLTLILSPIEDILAQKVEPAVKKRLKIAKRNAENILNLINQIVDVRKLETGNSILRIQHLDLVSFTRHTAVDFFELSKIKNIDFNIIAEEEEFPVWIDPTKFVFVINNLVSNAFKHSNENGKLNLYIKKHVNAEGSTVNERIDLIIEDNGKGYAAEDIPHLFDRFYHLSKNGSRISMSDGIGLDHSKKIISQHHGTISVESIQGDEKRAGLTKMCISLKVGHEHFDPSDIADEILKKYEETSLSKENYEPIEKIEESNPDQGNHGQNILVIDKDENITKSIRNQLQDQYHIYSTKDGMEGWKVALDLMPSLIIINEELEIIDGVELCQKIRTDERTLNIPIIFLMKEKRDDSFHRDLNADEYIEIDKNLDSIKSRVNTLISRREKIRMQFEKKSLLMPENISSHEENLIKDAIKYIDDNISDTNLSVDRLSKEIGISRVHFYRKIKSLMNMSPNEFIRSYRIRKAGQLLSQKKVNIDQIRHMVGFNDSDYFRSCFKKEFGMTPSEYNKKNVS